MYTEQEFLQALTYFTMPNHPNSFEILDGVGGVMLSAPHAVVQTRDGRVKQAERYTGMLCRLLNRAIGCPCIYKAKHMHDDANYDAVNAYKTSLCQYIMKHDIRCLLDLHQLSPDRPMEVCFGTGRGANLHGQEIVPMLADAFAANGVTRYTIDDPFSASGKNTVSATVAAVCGIPAVQIELNTALLCEACGEDRFAQVMAALKDAIQSLNKMRM